MSKLFPNLNKTHIKPKEQLVKNKVAQAVRKANPAPPTPPAESTSPSVPNGTLVAADIEQFIVSEELKVLAKQVDTHGYVTLYFKDKVYYTVGFGEQDRPDLFAFSLAPFAAFQVIADMYHKNEIKEDEAFLLPQLQMQANGTEPARIRLSRASDEDVNFIHERIAGAMKAFSPKGVLFVNFPDNNNRLYGEEPYLIPLSPSEMLKSMFQEEAKEPA